LDFLPNSTKDRTGTTVNGTFIFIKDMTLEQKIIQWARERGLLHPKNTLHQMLQIGEEIGEVQRAILREDSEAQKKEMGDVLVATIVLLEQVNMAMPDSLQKGENYIMDLIAYGDNAMNHREVTKTKYDALAEVLYQQTNVLKLLSKGTISTESVVRFLSYVIVFICVLDFSPLECLELAYESIKDRTGTTVNGVFTKYEV